MNMETTLQNLIEKAGSKKKLKDIDKRIKMRRYQSIKIFMTYEEYLKFTKIKNSDL